MSNIDKVITDAYKLIGEKAIKFDYAIEESFTKGNNLSSGFDCSGIWQYILIKNGFDLYQPELKREVRFAREFFDYFGTFINYGEHRKGDLVFFSWCGAMPTHMGLYIGDNKIIHKGFCDVSLSPSHSSGDYPKSIILSDLSVISNDRRNAGIPINYKSDRNRGEQKYNTNPIGFKRFFLNDN